MKGETVVNLKMEEKYDSMYVRVLRDERRLFMGCVLRRERERQA
jgi:hypothetical protein